MLAALSAFTGVALGAFGAHGLRKLLTPEMLQVYKTGVDYQMWHALALGLIATWVSQAQPSKLLHWAGCLMFAGIVLFSGSLYLLAVSNIKWLGMITPIGGVAFLGAWLLVIIFALNKGD